MGVKNIQKQNRENNKLCQFPWGVSLIWPVDQSPSPVNLWPSFWAIRFPPCARPVPLTSWPLSPSPWLFPWPSRTTQMLCRQPAHRDTECNSRCPALRPPPVFPADGPPPTTCSWSSDMHSWVVRWALWCPPACSWCLGAEIAWNHLGLQHTHLLQSFHLVQVQGPHFSCHCFRSTAPGLLLLNNLCCSRSNSHSWSTVFPNYLLKISLYCSHFPADLERTASQANSRALNSLVLVILSQHGQSCVSYVRFDVR